MGFHMTTYTPISNAANPLREAPPWGSLWERARVRSLPMRQIEVTMFAAGVGRFEAGRLIKRGNIDAIHDRLDIYGRI
jgi:hypothetical protein